MIFPVTLYIALLYGYENSLILPNDRVQIKKYLFAFFFIKMGKFLKINFSSELKGL